MPRAVSQVSYISPRFPLQIRHALPKDRAGRLLLGGEAQDDEARRRAMDGSDGLLVFFKLLRALWRERTSVDLNSSIRNDFRNMPIAELRERLNQLLA